MNAPIVIEASDPRLHVMISSTTVDLPDHRAAASEAIQRAKHTPVMMELGSAEWNSDAIKFSLQKVEQSQVYVGIFGLRYGYIPDDPMRNPDRLSITELEYSHAVKLGKPTLIYIAKDSHPFTTKQIDREPEKIQKLDRLKAELQKDICGFFDNPEELSKLILQSLYELQIHVGDKAKVVYRLPKPPDLYAVPNYILTSTFIGRATELDELDVWAGSTNPLMVVEGIGGLGKSALTWEWMQKRATYAIKNLAGRVWWSFYERGTSMKAFVHHALAYITEKEPDAIKEFSHYERCQLLLTELKRRPFLLLLDGFERVLTAYHRWDKAQQRDDKIEADLRECVDPNDGTFLQQLLHCTPSKVIISTRLFPSILENRTGQPIPGVAHHKLNGLSRP
ncbi:MAG: DUF4062 domain-containing protein, partial [Planctomycetes bacterium]|nr:DUF4062 domain-containing protein [Planctomycetota bacterium]